MTLLLLGLAIGVLLALTGAGGGILAVPALVFGAGLTVAQAAPIGLLAVGLAASLGAVLGLRAGIVRYKAALLVAATGVLCSPAGLWLAQHTPRRPLAGLFGVLLLYVAWRSWRGARGQQDKRAAAPPCRIDPATGHFAWTTRCARVLAASGAIAGTLSGLLGVGGGFVLVPAFKRHTDLPVQAIVATSLAVIALVSAAGVAFSAGNGQVQWQVALPFSAAALAGMVGGRSIAARLAGQRLQQGFAILCAGVALAMIARSLA